MFMARTPEEVYAEIATWPLTDRLRLAARLLEAGAAELSRTESSSSPQPPSAARPASHTGPGVSSNERQQRSDQPPAAAPERGAANAPVRASSPAPRAAGSVGADSAGEARRLVLVDGSNFLGTVPGFDLATEAARDELIMRLQDFAHSHPSIRVTVYFDGRKTSVKRTGRVEVRFSPAQKPADFYILAAIRALGQAERQRAVLVTADRSLAEAARKLGARVEAPSSFHHRLLGTRRASVGERGLSAAEVADWEAYFQQPPKPGPRG